MTVDSLQCRMQVQGTDSVVPKSSGYSGPLDCALKTIKSEGVRKMLCSVLSNIHMDLS